MPGFEPGLAVAGGLSAERIARTAPMPSKRKPGVWDGRGSVFWCALDSKQTPDALIGGKPRRPYVLLDNRPFSRLREGLSVSGVPLSSRVKGSLLHSSRVAGNGKKGRALPNLAVTIRPEQVHEFMFFTSDDEEKHISSILSDELQPIAEWSDAGWKVGGPGAILGVRDRQKQEQLFVVVGSRHLMANLHSPVLVAPVDTIRMAKDKVIDLEIEPRSFGSLVSARSAGRLCLADTLKFQSAVRSKFGLNPSG